MTIATIRDIAIIILAFLNIVLMVLLVALVYILVRLLLLIRSEILPVLGSLKKTTTTVEGTTDFVSTTVVRPLIRLTALMFAVTRFVQVLFGRNGSQGESH